MKSFYSLIRELLIPDPGAPPTKGRILLALAIIVFIVVALSRPPSVPRVWGQSLTQASDTASEWRSPRYRSIQSG
jgi:hypothetical protein